MNRRLDLSTALLFTLALCGWGCGGDSRSKYVPQSTTAREALQTALDKWKSGAGLNPIETPRAVINVFDARWRDRNRLESFEIVEEIKSPDQPTFKVRMQVKGQPEETTTYLIIGLNPLNVYREEDYKEHAQTM
ncbi:MAG: hypothetical protein JSS49_28470 [Planctomycetes bacterium]|nr:hypothetical protein [Planctomycetota bacterium]